MVLYRKWQVFTHIRSFSSSLRLTVVITRLWADVARVFTAIVSGGKNIKYVSIHVRLALVLLINFYTVTLQNEERRRIKKKPITEAVPFFSIRNFSANTRRCKMLKNIYFYMSILFVDLPLAGPRNARDERTRSWVRLRSNQRDFSLFFSLSRENVIGSLVRVTVDDKL